MRLAEHVEGHDRREHASVVRDARRMHPLMPGTGATGRPGLGSGDENWRRYDEAAQQLQGVIKIEPTFSFAHVYLGYAYLMKGMYKEAIAEYQTQLSLEGETTSTLCYLGYALAQSGKRSEAQATLDKLKTTKAYVSPAELAVLYAGLGDKEGAIASLEKAYAAHDLQMQYLKVEPHYDSLRGEPRFQDLMRKVGLPQ